MQRRPSECARCASASASAADVGDWQFNVSEDDLRAIAKHGYESAVTTDHDQEAQAVGLFTHRRGSANLTAYLAALLQLGATSLNENEQGHKRALFGDAAQKVERARIDKHSSRATPPAQSSHAHRTAALTRGPAGREPAGRCVSTQRPFLTATSSLSPSTKIPFCRPPAH
jgi:hypothetical protein